MVGPGDHQGVQRAGIRRGDSAGQRDAVGGGDGAAPGRDQEGRVRVAERAGQVEDLQRAAEVEQGQLVEHEEGDPAGRVLRRHVRIRGTEGRKDMAPAYVTA